MTNVNMRGVGVVCEAIMANITGIFSPLTFQDSTNSVDLGVIATFVSSVPIFLRMCNHTYSILIWKSISYF